MQIGNIYKVNKPKTKTRWSLNTSTKLLGLGFMIDTQPMHADRRRSWVVDVKLLFISFWIYRYKK